MLAVMRIARCFPYAGTSRVDSNHLSDRVTPVKPPAWICVVVGRPNRPYRSVQAKGKKPKAIAVAESDYTSFINRIARAQLSVKRTTLRILLLPLSSTNIYRTRDR